MSGEPYRDPGPARPDDGEVERFGRLMRRGRWSAFAFLLIASVEIGAWAFAPGSRVTIWLVITSVVALVALSFAAWIAQRFRRPSR